MVNISAKFDYDALNGSVFLVFTVNTILSIVVLTFNLQNQYGSSSHHG